MIDLRNRVNNFNLKMQLAKPNREIMENGNITKAFARTQRFQLGRLNELSFSLPFYVEKLEGGEMKKYKNPLIFMLESQHLVKATYLNTTEWYILSNSKISKDKKSCTVQLMSLGYQLRNKKIREWAGIYIDGEYRKESLTAEDVLENILQDSSWSVKYIDSEFRTNYRYFDFSNTTALDMIYQVAETFGGIIEWDTVNKQISLIKQENAGINRGLRITDKTYLKNVTQDRKHDEIITRLKVYGQDGLSIQEVNPTGADYLEDFSYFMYGFEREKVDGEWVTISSSKRGMSDKLCNELLDYNLKIERFKDIFNDLVTRKNQLEQDKKPFELELSKLIIDLVKTRSVIEVRQAQGLDYAELKQIENDLISQISVIESNISTINDQIESLADDIAVLREDVALDNVVSTESLIELDSFIIIDNWEDSNYTDALTLYKDANKAFEDMKKPPTEYSLDIVNFYNTVEGSKDIDKLYIGDKFYCYEEELEIDIETQLTEISIGHDDNNISIVFANTKDINTGEDKLSKLLYNSINTSSVVNMSKYKWDAINRVETEVSQLIDGKWDAAKREILAGTNESVIINERGITIEDPTDRKRYVRLMHGIIGMTNDEGNTFKLAITPEGIVAEELIGKITITENLFIENESGKYRFNQDGFVIDGGSLTITGGLPKSQLDPSFADGLVEINKDYTNGVRMDSVNGLVITRNDGKVRAIFNASDGLKFQVSEGGSYTDKLYFDPLTSNLVVDGVINARDLQIKGRSVLTADDFINGDVIKTIKTDQIIAGNAKITTAMIESLQVGKNVIMGSDAYISWSQVTGRPTIPSTPEEIGALPANSQKLTNITSTGIYTGTLSADKINGGTISGVNINVTTDLYVGDSIYLGGGGSGTRKLVFDRNNINTTWIESNVYGLTFSTSGTINISGASNILTGSTSFRNTVDFSGATVTGLNTTAKFG